MKTLQFALIVTILISSTVTKAQSTGKKENKSFIEKIQYDYTTSIDEVKLKNIGTSEDNPFERISLEYDGILWQEISKNIYTYNSTGLVSRNIFLNKNLSTGEFDTAYVLEYTYTQDDYLKELIRRDYINNAWQLNSKETFVYNILGNLVEHLQYVRMGDSWELNSGTRKEYVFNDNNLYYLTWYSYDKGQTMWSSVQMAMATYNNDEPESVTFFDMAGPLYFEKIKFDSLVWRDYNNQNPTSYLIHQWTTNNWQNIGRIAYQYASDEKMIHMQLNDYRLEKNFHNNFGYDLNGDLIELYTEYYIWNVSGIIKDRGFRLFENYDDQNREITEFIDNYDSTSGMWITNEKFEYKYAQVSTGTPSPTLKEININAYPNPVKDAVTISATGIEKEVSVTIFDIIGKEVYRNEYKSLSETTIDLSALRSGNYIIAINSEGFSKAIKIVKQ